MALAEIDFSQINFGEYVFSKLETDMEKVFQQVDISHAPFIFLIGQEGYPVACTGHHSA